MEYRVKGGDSLFRRDATVEEFLEYLDSKGFKFDRQEYGFIFFGQTLTGASDYLVNIAIEITLKLQREFDGSYFVGVLEALQAQKIHTRKEAFLFIKQKNTAS
nr:DUF6123 family protein [Bacillus marinisedimentorum]